MIRRSSCVIRDPPEAEPCEVHFARIDYLRQHTEQMARAVDEDGVDLIGYTPWGVAVSRHARSARLRHSHPLGDSIAQAVAEPEGGLCGVERDVAAAGDHGRHGAGQVEGQRAERSALPEQHP